VTARKLTQDQIDQAAELREQGLSIGQIANRFRCSEGWIYYVLLRAGADSPKVATRELPQTALGPSVSMRNGRLVRHFQPAEDALILRLSAGGMGETAIGRALEPPRRPHSVKARLMTLARHEARRDAARDAIHKARMAPATAARP
jgi:hypothetical protein